MVCDCEWADRRLLFVAGVDATSVSGLLGVVVVEGRCARTSLITGWDVTERGWVGHTLSDKVPSVVSVEA
jgi:hypothetical protein